MAFPVKTVIKLGIATGAAILLFQVADLFLVYHYFTFEYYLAAVAVIFLVVGIVISRRKQVKPDPLPVKIDALHELTLKEIQILKQIAEGKSNKEIAEANFIELSTVKTHINNIYSKLGVRNRKDAIGVYIEAEHTP